MKFANLSPIPFHQVKLDSAFWSPRVATIRKETTRYCLKRCEETSRIANFRRAGGLEEGGFEGIYFNDSDVYKVLEGVAYTLQGGADPELEAAADTVINAICSAQREDGYLFTFFTLTGLEKRWTDMGYHEDYCLGHMLEGAIAYYQATGKDRWLKAATKALRHMMSVIGPGKKHWVVGHQELELAVMKLYRLTGEEDYLAYAQWLVNERGHGHLDAPSFRKQNFHEEYCQDDLPAEQLSRVTGHAVRAMYYYSGMADIAAVTGNEALAAALDRLWNNVVPGNLYVTGGIGQSASNEGFTRDFHLPNLTAYCETCAAIGMALWNQRMNLLHGDAKYADLVETEMYNGVLSGISLDGLRFFYDNPLASAGAYRRSEWFGCSCCPTNLVRFIPSIGGYAYATDGEAVYVNQYIASQAEFAVGGRTVQLSVKTEYPWSGRVTIGVLGGEVKLKLRIPGWCDKYTLCVNGKALAEKPQNGYVTVAVPDGGDVTLDLSMPARRIHADKRVKEDLGRVAFARGPIVYCAEEIDQRCDIPTEYFHADFAVDAGAPIQTEECPDILGGIVALRAGEARLIPYYAWCNRDRGGMAVWIKESK
jgi:DUF1680 family protein